MSALFSFVFLSIIFLVSFCLAVYCLCFFLCLCCLFVLAVPFYLLACQHSHRFLAFSASGRVEPEQEDGPSQKTEQRRRREDQTSGKRTKANNKQKQTKEAEAKWKWQMKRERNRRTRALNKLLLTGEWWSRPVSAPKEIQCHIWRHGRRSNEDKHKQAHNLLTARTRKQEIHEETENRAYFKILALWALAFLAENERPLIDKLADLAVKARIKTRTSALGTFEWCNLTWIL